MAEEGARKKARKGIKVYSIPICPFCQRLEILMALKGLTLEVEVVDITKPRDEKILELTGGSTALPVMELPNGQGLKESMVLLNYLEDAFPQVQVKRTDPFERAVENLFVSMEGRVSAAGYRLVLNQDKRRRQALVDEYLAIFEELNKFLLNYSTGDSPFLFDRFGWAEAVYTPLLQRFWFIEYYEKLHLEEPGRFGRVKQWWNAAIAHEKAQQTCYDEVIANYYDYSRGASNGSLPTGRKVSSFSFQPHWKTRPRPPSDKYDENGATDAQLGLVIEK